MTIARCLVALALLSLASTTRAGTGDTRPVNDHARHSFVLGDLLEWTRVSGIEAFRWDVAGWHGSDQRRLWLGSSGIRFEGGGGEFDVQLLHGRAVTPYFEFLAGARFEQHQEGDATPRRGFAVIGVRGLAPYRIELQGTLELSSTGRVMLRATFVHDTRWTQRWVLQQRLELEVAGTEDDGFGVSSGLNESEVGLRLRREVRREVAPYVGISYRRAWTATRDRVRREGGATDDLQAVVGVRAWF